MPEYRVRSGAMDRRVTAADERAAALAALRAEVDSGEGRPLGVLTEVKPIAPETIYAATEALLRELGVEVREGEADA